MTNRSKKITLYSVVILALFISPLFSWAAPSIEELHRQTDFEGMRKRVEEMARRAESGHLGQQVYSERNVTSSHKYTSTGGLFEVSIYAGSAHGQMTKTELKAGYAPGTALEVEGRLAAAKGSYKVEFKNEGRVSLTLESKDGSSADGKGIAIVDSQGRLPYVVTATHAEDVSLTLNVRIQESHKE